MKKNEIRKPSIEKPWLKFYSPEVINSSLPEFSIYEYLKYSNEKYLSRTALIYYGKLISYKKLIKNIDIVAESFKNRGIKEKDIVSISMPTIPEAIYVFYALSKIGAVANMIDPRKSPEEIEEYVKEVKSKILIVIDVAFKKIESIKQKTSVEEIIVVSPSESLPDNTKTLYKIKNMSVMNKKSLSKVTKWKDFYNAGKGRIRFLTEEETKPIPYRKDRPIVIVYTGGTTGLSKGVVLTNDNINAATYQCIHCGFDFQRQHRWLNIMPPFIAYGIGNGLHLPLVCGMEVVIIPQFNAKKFDRLLAKYKPNHITGVPTHYDSILKSKALKNESLMFLYSAIVGGDKLDEKLEVKVNAYFDKHNCNYNIAKGYGLSEVMAAVCATSKMSCNKVGSVGIPFPHTTISIFDPEMGEEKSYNEVGEVCIAGPNLMKCYYNNEKETNAVIKVHDDGLKWMHSGDIGYMDEEGNIFIVGRIKEVIVRNDGFKVFPILIEKVILNHPAVQSCKVIGIKDNTYSQGELPKAIVVLNDKANYNQKEVINEIENLCHEKLAEYLQPAEIEIKDELPLTLIGKIDYMSLKKENETTLKSK